MFDQVEARLLRLFFGLPLPGDLHEHLSQWQRTFPGIEGWSRPEGLHLTLAFLGQRPMESLPSLERIAATVAFPTGPWPCALRRSAASLALDPPGCSG